ncbi:MAG: FG-GAP-like repeat-containing protein [Prevotellaceae bacterium]|jgi:hypothetical protein|nr:FG-GAP-like repeat-containing protein [Prevotellaceae bacterium]
MNKSLLLFLFIIVPTFLSGQNNLIPNTADCSSVGQPFQFDIKEAWISQTGNDISTCATPLAGDIDGDGVVEIFALAVSSQDKLYVLDGRDGSTITTIGIKGHIAHGVTPNIVLCKIDGKGAIFNAGKDGSLTLYAVTSEPGARPITFDKKWSVASGGITPSSMPIATDFDGDGIVEFVARGQIIDSQDGTILAVFPQGSSISYDFDAAFHTAMDLDGDGIPEITAGTEVYKYSRGTGLQLWRSLSTVASIAVQNGISTAADIDQDGNVDLAFSSNNHAIYVWTPNTNTLIGTISVPGSGYHSYVFIGDIDGEVVNGKKYPELVYNSISKLYTYKYNGSTFAQKWEMGHSDTSGATSLTLFDFNNDNVVELVYRDETHIRIFDGRPDGTLTLSDALYSRNCGSVTCDETPIVLDVTGDGSANIVVTGHQSTKSHPGEVMVFEGSASKWASCPPVWNQQMYSPLYVNTDLSIPKTVKPVNTIFIRQDQDNTPVQFYNGGPMQAPYVSANTFLSVNLSPDVYVVEGGITVNSATSVTLTVTFGNQGLAVATASIPIRYYKNDIAAANIIGSEILGTDLYPGQVKTITKQLDGIPAGTSRFYVQIMDDGTHFPAAGPYSDCNLTNNKKAFGTLELEKTANAINACVNGTSVFYVDLKNNTDQLGNPTLFTNISLIDSLGTGWQLISANASYGTPGSYNPGTRKMEWTVPSLDAGESAQLVIVAKATEAGSIRNNVWVQSINGTVLGKEAIEAYVQVDVTHAPLPPIISPADPKLCSSDITLTATPPGTATSYQWFKDNIEIPGATQSTLITSDIGSYTVTYFDGTCVSQMSAPVAVKDNCLAANPDIISTISASALTADILANDILTGCTSDNVTVTLSTIKTAQNGIANITGNKLVYTPDGHGVDSLRYILQDCNGTYKDSAMVYIIIHETPDNVSDAECFIPAKAMDWGIQEAQSLGSIHVYTPPLTGDMDGNDLPEIVAGMARAGSTSHGGTHISIFKDGGAGTRVDFPLIAQYQGFTPGVMALARVKVSNTQDISMIVVAESDGYLRAYNIDGTNIWTSTSDIPGVSAKWREVDNINYGTSVAFADFNGDGYAEVYAGNKIFDAATGKLLCYGGSANNRGFSANAVITDLTMTIAANVYGDEKPELIAGNQVYEVNIVSRANPALNSMNAVRRVTPPSSFSDDGLTQVIDIDNDGTLDVVVQKRNPTTLANAHLLYIWSPDKEKVLTSTILTTANVIGVPFMGDIDKDGKPEIVVITSNYPQSGTDHCFIHALKYDGTQTLQPFWKMKHADNSGQTGITLFDFNQDGKAELVYRDEQYLRILNGSGVDDNDNDMIVAGTLDIEAATRYKVKSISGTGYEYPVVADINNDGQAEIIVGGAESGDSQTNLLRVFKSADPTTAPWAPARKVWNQYAYNAVNVNEDLTIPRLPLSLAVVFPGEDGIPGTNDDVRPYNAYLQQQTTLNKNGMPLWLAPEASFDGSLAYTWNTYDNTLEIKVKVKNIGDADLIAPVYATAYKNSIADANKLATGGCTTNIAPNTTEELTIVVPNISDKLPITDIHVRLNDNDGTYPVQRQCKYNDNELDKPIAQIPKAADDIFYVRSDTPSTNDILANDSHDCNISDLNVTIVPPATTNGTASINPDKTLSYRSNNLFSDTDLIYYKIRCDGSDDASVAIAYMVIQKPIMVEVVPPGKADENGLVPAYLKFMFTDDVTHHKDVEITYLIEPTSTAPATDYTLNPAPSKITIQAGQREALLKLTPVQNHIVQGGREVKITITDVTDNFTP